MQNLDGGLWLERAAPTDTCADTDARPDAKAVDSQPRWTAQLRHLKIAGRNCIVPLLNAVLRFAPRLETLENDRWSGMLRFRAVRSAAPISPPPSPPLASKASEPPGSARVAAVAAGALVRVKVCYMDLKECGALPATLTDLDVEWAATVTSDGSRLLAEEFAAIAADRFPRLARLRFGRHCSAVSLVALAERLPHLTDLEVPECALPVEPLVHSRLERLVCKFVVSAGTVSVSGGSWFDARAATPRPRTLHRLPSLRSSLLSGPSLHTLDLTTTMSAFAGPRVESVLAVVASAAPTLARLAGLRVTGDTEFSRAAFCLASAGARLRELQLWAPGVTTMEPLAEFSETLRMLELAGFYGIAVLLESVALNDGLTETVGRLWPPLPRLERLSLADVLDERDMRAVFARYPSVVDGGESRASDTREPWRPVTAAATVASLSRFLFFAPVPAPRSAFSGPPRAFVRPLLSSTSPSHFAVSCVAHTGRCPRARQWRRRFDGCPRRSSPSCFPRSSCASTVRFATVRACTRGLHVNRPLRRNWCGYARSRCPFRPRSGDPPRSRMHRRRNPRRARNGTQSATPRCEYECRGMGGHGFRCRSSCARWPVCDQDAPRSRCATSTATSG
jgi:hypothetical protein